MTWSDIAVGRRLFRYQGVGSAIVESNLIGSLGRDPTRHCSRHVSASKKRLPGSDPNFVVIHKWKTGIDILERLTTSTRRCNCTKSAHPSLTPIPVSGLFTGERTFFDSKSNLFSTSESGLCSTPTLRDNKEGINREVDYNSSIYDRPDGVCRHVRRMTCSHDIGSVIRVPSTVSKRTNNTTKRPPVVLSWNLVLQDKGSKYFLDIHELPDTRVPTHTSRFLRPLVSSEGPKT